MTTVVAQATGENDFVGSVTEGGQVTVEVRYTKDWSQYEFEWSC